MNVLIVSVDALRFDLLAPDSPHRTDFPRMTGFLDQATWFQHAEAPAAGTDVSLPTFVTGRWDPFQPLQQTLIESMKASGRRTGVIFPREVLRYVPELLLTRGSDDTMRVISDTEQRDVGDRVTAKTTTDDALGFLDKTGAQPWFLWAHYFDVHEHHQLTVPKDLLDAVDPGASELEHGYRALAHGVDAQIGRLLDELDRRGLADHTIVVFFADHGESLHEDPRLPDNHGTVVYQALTHIPFAIRVPGAAGHVDLEPVSLVDFTPTLTALTGAPPPPELEGVDLTPNLLGAPDNVRHHERALVMHEDQQWGVVEWPWKLLVRPADNLIELYNLDHDPGETIDVASQHADIVADLKGRFGEFPDVPMDRTRAGRKWREEQARPPTAPSP
jgi:membrane-anchored protein YejM (alkaline phosphatase superfamily)